MLAIQRYSAVGAVDTAFRVYRGHMRPLLLLSAAVNVPNLVLGAGLAWIGHRFETFADTGGGEPDMESLFGLFAVLFGLVAAQIGVQFVTSTLGLTGTAQMASEAATGGQPTLRGALHAIRQVFWRALAARGLTLGMILLGTMACFVPGIYLALRFALLGPVLVLEERSVTDAISRTWALSARREGKIFLTALLTTVVVDLLAMGFQLTVEQILTGALPSAGALGAVVGATLALVISVLGTPLWYLATVLLYYDARVDSEAFDVRYLLQRADSAPAAPATAT
jgi:hypothetical protein